MKSTPQLGALWNWKRHRSLWSSFYLHWIVDFQNGRLWKNCPEPDFALLDFDAIVSLCQPVMEAHKFAGLPCQELFPNPPQKTDKDKRVRCILGNPIVLIKYVESSPNGVRRSQSSTSTCRKKTSMNSSRTSTKAVVTKCWFVYLKSNYSLYPRSSHNLGDLILKGGNFHNQNKFSQQFEKRIYKMVLWHWGPTLYLVLPIRWTLLLKK